MWTALSAGVVVAVPCPFLLRRREYDEDDSLGGDDGDCGEDRSVEERNFDDEVQSRQHGAIPESWTVMTRR